MITDTALSWALVHFLWQGTGIAALLALGLGALRSPRARYLAGCLALLLLALAPVVTYLWLQRPGPVQEVGPLTLALGSGDGLSRAVIGAEPQSWLAWLPFVWLTGVLALSARLLLAAVAVRRLTRRDSAPLTDRWPHLRDRLGIARAVTFLTSSRVAGPLQAGFLKPVILLPASLLTQLPAAQLEAIIAHELAHIARHDYLVNLLQNVVETLLFYHPAVWWTSRVVRTERELCCDEMAAAVTGNPRQYAEALINLEEMAMSQMNLTNAATGGDLRRRIARLLGQSESPTKLRLPAVLLALLLAGAIVLPSRQSRAQVPSPTPAVEPASAQEELARLRREVADLRAQMAARVQQNAQPAQLSALEAERLSLSEAQRSLERLALSQAETLRAAEADFARQQAQAEAALQGRFAAEEATEARLAQLLRAEQERIAQREKMQQQVQQQREALRERLAQLRQLDLPTQSEPGLTPVQTIPQSRFDRWLHEDVVYLISAAEVERFSSLKTDEEREQFILQFWARRDPNPDTPENEMKVEHYRRINYANLRFSTATELGWKTPRGRTYIQKGPPDEIESHPNERRENWLYRSPREILEFKL